MKDAYIIFRNEYPQNKEEVFSLIKEFCRKHDLYCSGPITADSLLISIEGEIY